MRFLIPIVAGLLPAIQAATAPATAAECLLKIDGAVNGILAPLSKQYNSKTVWQLVDPATGAVAAKDPVYMFWNVAGTVWNIGAEMDESKPVYGYAKLAADIVCPADGSRYMTDDGSGYKDTGYIYQILNPEDGLCSPVAGSLTPVGTDSKITGATVSECVRNVKATIPDATAVSLVGGSCYTSSDAKVALDTTGADVSCMKRCNVLPGGAALFGGVAAVKVAAAAGDGTSALQCAAAAFTADANSVGADYSAAKCYGLTAMQTIDIAATADFSCFVGTGADLTVAAARDAKALPAATLSPGYTTTTTTSGAATVKVSAVLSVALLVAALL